MKFMCCRIPLIELLTLHITYTKIRFLEKKLQSDLYVHLS